MFYKGEQTDLRKLYGGVAMERLYAAIGILAFVVARVAPRCDWQSRHTFG